MPARIGVSTLHLLNRPLRSAIDVVKRYGLRTVELVDEGPHSLSRSAVSFLIDVKGSHDFEYVVHAPFVDVNIASPNDMVRRAVLRRLTRSIRFASDLMCKLWVFHPGIRTPLDYFLPGESWRICVESAREIVKVAEDHGLMPLIENQTSREHHILNVVADFRSFFEEVTGNLKIALDVGHAHLFRQIDTFFRALPDRIGHIHVSDNRGDFDEHLGLGHGSINWLSFARRVRAMGFDGAVVVESLSNVPESIERLRDLLRQ